MAKGQSVTCPALLISAPASGQGKTTVTAGLARLHRNRGCRVRVFKTGPDFLDPMILGRASGQLVYQLDLWMCGEDHCRHLLFDAAKEADLILVEGVMGLLDGNPSSADLAARFGIPVLGVIDASAMAQTFGAVAHGLATYRPDVPFAGVLANRVASPGHAAMLMESVPPGVRWFGALPGDRGFALPDRHLGLVQAEEVEDLDRRLDQAAATIAKTALAGLPGPVRFEPGVSEPLPVLLKGTVIGVARDQAFSFLYPANLNLLRALGAELRFFSPLNDASLLPCDSLYLPGGYPELHLERLSANASMKAAIRAHHAANKPIVAECGGMLYLLESLAGLTGNAASMVGLLPGNARMQERLTNLGLHRLQLPEGELRGHAFHHSRTEMALDPIAFSEAAQGHGRPELVYRLRRLHASYMHLYFPSNPQAVAKLFRP